MPVVESTSLAASASGTVTRPADTTAYASGDLVANSTTAGSVTPISLVVGRDTAKPFELRRLKLSKSTTGITSASFRVHFYTSSPTVSNGDNGAWVSTEAGYLGWVDVTIDKAFSASAAGIGVPASGVEVFAIPSATTIYALIEARGAYTPGSAEVFTLTVWGYQD